MSIEERLEIIENKIDNINKLLVDLISEHKRTQTMVNYVSTNTLNKTRAQTRATLISDSSKLPTLDELVAQDDKEVESAKNQFAIEFANRKIQAAENYKNTISQVNSLPTDTTLDKFDQDEITAWKNEFKDIDDVINKLTN